jgi:hypothetical protein
LVLIAQDPYPHKLKRKNMWNLMVVEVCTWTLRRLILLPNSYTNLVYNYETHRALHIEIRTSKGLTCKTLVYLVAIEASDFPQVCNQHVAECNTIFRIY